MAGRPSKLTRKLRLEVVRLIEIGCNYKVTCAVVGITYETFRRWMLLGRDPDYDPANRRYRVFYVAVKRARHLLEVNCLQRITLASMDPKLWTAACWLLQHVIGGKYRKSAAMINKPVMNVTMSDIAKTLEENGEEGSPYQLNGNGSSWSNE